MKKIGILLLLGMLAMSITACGKKQQNNESTQQSSTQQTETMETQNTEAANSATAETQGITNTTGADGWSTELSSVKTAIVDALGENYWPDTAIPAEMLEGTYGITSDLYDDYLGEMPMISTNVDTLLIIRAKDGKVEEVEKALNAYRDNLVADTMQYPMNLGKIQASRIERFGSYVCFVQLGADTMEASEHGEEAVITQCQQQNELVLEIIGQNLAQ